MMHYRFEAEKLFGKVATQRTHLFKMAILSAMGLRSLEGKRPLIRDNLSSTVRGLISFYPNEALMLKPPRIIVALTDRDDRNGVPARAEIDLEYTEFTHGREAAKIEVCFPDRILGLGKVLGIDTECRYTSVYFNLTPGELSANLYDFLNPICAAFSAVERLHEDGLEIPLESVSTSQKRSSGVQQTHAL